LRKALVRLLRTMDYDAVTFASAEAFLQTGLLIPPDCLLLDVELSGMSGIGLLEYMVSLGSKLPVILMTAHDDVQLRLHAAHMGVVAYLRKPLDEQDLLPVLQQVLGQKT
jgi:FixJ family two-component response regulator